MCCARFCGGGFGMGGCWGRNSRSCIEMVRAVRDEMKVAYPELVETAERVSKTVLAEEEQFARVLATSCEYQGDDQAGRSHDR